MNVVLSNVSGYVKYASCDCKASSLGRCAHIAAVLLKLSDTSTAEENIVTPSTSKPCIWNKGKEHEKKPQKFHLAEYASRKRKSQHNIIIGIQDLKKIEDLVSQVFQTLSLACAVNI